MNIIVLGGTGYLGSHIIKNIVSLNAHGGGVNKLLCLTRGNSSTNFLDSVKDKVEFCNISDLDSFLKSAEPYDILINTACKYPRNARSDSDIFDANLTAPLNVFLTCIAHGVKNIITIGTGLPDEFNTYALSKKKLADIMRWYVDQYKSLGKELNIFNVELENFYGEDEPVDRFIPGTVKKLKENLPILLTEGTQIRDFIYIEDVLNAIMILLKADSKGYTDIPLGTGEGIAVRDMIKSLKDILGSQSELHFGAVAKRTNEPDSVANTSKMKEYGINIQYKLQDGLKKFL